MDRVSVRVPATTANLGPGFDSLGCAFALYDYVTFSKEESGLNIIGDNPKYCNDHNLLIRGYKAVMDELGLPMDGLTVSVEYNVPMSHGLGSSAALIVAGAVAANALHSSPLSRLDLLRVCNPIEGHPDNLAPALFGGLTASLVEDGIPLTVKYDIHESVRFTVLIPEFNLSTKQARSVLPDSIPRQDAVFNVSHVAVLLKALETGNSAALKAALQDRLHQPYRCGLIGGYGRLRQLALSCGCDGFCISGAGPTLLCVATDPDFYGRMEKEMTAFPGWRIAELKTDYEGAVIL